MYPSHNVLNCNQVVFNGTLEQCVQYKADAENSSISRFDWFTIKSIWAV